MFTDFVFFTPSDHSSLHNIQPDLNKSGLQTSAGEAAVWRSGWGWGGGGEYVWGGWIEAVVWRSGWGWEGEGEYVWGGWIEAVVWRSGWGWGGEGEYVWGGWIEAVVWRSGWGGGGDYCVGGWIGAAGSRGWRDLVNEAGVQNLP